MKITVQQASQILGCDPLTVREMLKSDGCLIGTAFKPEGHNRWTYIIYPKAFEWYVGTVKKGEQND